MSASPTPGEQQARQALADRLREVREDAGLNAKELAAAVGWHRTKISKIEHAARPPSSEDIRAWCRACGAEEQIPDLLAALRTVEGMYVEWRRMVRSGLRRFQEAAVPLYERTRHFRIYEPGVIPGLFQTPAYARARMSRIVAFAGLPDDVEEAVAARMARQHVVYEGGRRFSVVLEEWALRSRIGSAEMMTGQLHHLATCATAPSVSVGIVPAGIERTMWSSPGFWIFDEDRVLMETPTAELTITQPREIAVYGRVFAELASMAVYGAEARELIASAVNDLG